MHTHLVVGMKTPAGYTSLCQYFAPPGCQVGVEHASEMRHELATMCQPISQGPIAWIVEQGLLSQGTAQPLPLCLGPGTDGEIPVPHAQGLVRHAVRHPTAAGHGTLPGRKKFCDTAHLQRHCRLEHGGHDVLTRPGLLTCYQSSENRWDRERRGIEVDKADVA